MVEPSLFQGATRRAGELSIVLIRGPALRTKHGRGLRKTTEDVKQRATCVFVLAVYEHVVRLVVVGQQTAVAARLAVRLPIQIEILDQSFPLPFATVSRCDVVHDFQCPRRDGSQGCGFDSEAGQYACPPLRSLKEHDRLTVVASG